MRRLLFALLAATAVASSAHAESTPVPATTAPAQKNLLTGVDVMSATVLQEGQSSFSGLGLRVTPSGSSPGSRFCRRSSTGGTAAP